MPPSTGIFKGATAEKSNLINYADLRTQGWDLQLNSKNLTGQFQWNSSLLLSYTKNKVTAYKGDENLQMWNYLNIPSVPVKGESRDIIYSYPAYNLDPETGLVPLQINGTTYDRASDFINANTLESLVMSGVKIPPLYGSLRNDFKYKRFDLSVLLSMKSGYVIRRATHGPQGEYALQYHMDYLDRWQQPGDEKHTIIPRTSAESTENLFTSLTNFENFISSGSHIRLQDVNLSYTLPSSSNKGFADIRIFGYARNLGILWKANRHGIDPDFANAEYKTPRSFALGIQANF